MNSSNNIKKLILILLVVYIGSYMLQMVRVASTVSLRVFRGETIYYVYFSDVVSDVVYNETTNTSTTVSSSLSYKYYLDRTLHYIYVPLEWISERCFSIKYAGSEPGM